MSSSIVCPREVSVVVCSSSMKEPSGWKAASLVSRSFGRVVALPLEDALQLMLTRDEPPRLYLVPGRERAAVRTWKLQNYSREDAFDVVSGKVRGCTVSYSHQISREIVYNVHFVHCIALQPSRLFVPLHCSRLGSSVVFASQLSHLLNPPPSHRSRRRDNLLRTCSPDFVNRQHSALIYIHRTMLRRGGLKV